MDGFEPVRLGPGGPGGSGGPGLAAIQQYPEDTGIVNFVELIELF